MENIRMINYKYNASLELMFAYLAKKLGTNIKTQILSMILTELYHDNKTEAVNWKLLIDSKNDDYLSDVNMEDFQNHSSSSPALSQIRVNRSIYDSLRNDFMQEYNLARTTTPYFLRLVLQYKINKICSDNKDKDKKKPNAAVNKRITLDEFREKEIHEKLNILYEIMLQQL